MFLAILSFFNRFPEKELSPIVKKSFEKTTSGFSRIAKGNALRRIDIPSGPCIPGQMRLLVDVSGNFFPCERVSEKSNSMCIGSVKDGFDIQKANHLLNAAKLTQAECCKCWCFRYCLQCAKSADDENGELSSAIKLKHCEESKVSAYARIMDFLLFKELDFYYSKQIRIGQKRKI
jgi:uncharacterized protein